MKNLLKILFKHSFKIDSNVKDAKVSYIVDAYDRSKDIVCYTPCQFIVPWEPCRKLNEAKLLIEKDGYISKVVNFKRGTEIFIQFILISFILGMVASFIHFKYAVPEYMFFIVFIVLICKISLGSSDLNVELKK